MGRRISNMTMLLHPALFCSPASIKNSSKVQILPLRSYSSAKRNASHSVSVISPPIPLNHPPNDSEMTNNRKQ